MSVSRDGLVTYLVDNFGVRADDLTDEAPLFSKGLLDSFHLVDLVGYIEGAAGIKVGAMEVNLDNLDSIGKILAFVASKQG